jgi:hypothetical protein
MISHPFQEISFKNTIIFTIISLIVTLLISSQLNTIGQPLTIPGTSPLGILSLEFAWTGKNAQDIVKAWRNTDALDAAIYLQWLDFYSSPLIQLCLVCYVFWQQGY